MLRRLFDLLFYGHVWIALAAAALGWQTTVLTGLGTAVHRVHVFLFYATLGVYTLHRWLTFRRAGGRSEFVRYQLVATHPKGSLLVGFLSITLSSYLLVRLPGAVWLPLLYALPFTAFYLIPLWPGGPRLRDLPYLKTLWVATAWTLMTVNVPLAAVGEPLDWAEFISRFCLTGAVALTFDLRDVELDRRQGVRTLAADHPSLNRSLTIGFCCLAAVVAFFLHDWPYHVSLVVAYFFIGHVLAYEGQRTEDDFASMVNGTLLLAPFFVFLTSL